MARFFEFNSFEEMMEHIRKNEEEVAKLVTEGQKQMKPGDMFLRYDPDMEVVIYGEILDPGVPAAPYDKGLSEDDLEEIRQDGERYKAPGMALHRFCRCYSVLCPEGELGDVHVVTMEVKVSKNAFEALRQNEWPAEVKDAHIVCVLNGSAVYIGRK